MRMGDTRMSCANRYWVSPRGFMKSSNNTSPGWIGERVLFISLLSRVVIYNLYVSGLVGDPFKANTPLVINSDTVLSRAAGPIPLYSIAPPWPGPLQRVRKGTFTSLLG